MKPRHLALVLFALTACDSKPTDGAASAKPTQSAAAKASGSSAGSGAKPAVAPAPTAAASTTPAASGSSEEAGPAKAKSFEKGEEFLELWKPADGVTVQPIPNYEGWQFTGPKGIKWPGRTGDTAWGSFDVGGKPMAVLVASPEQDQGAQCFPMADAKKKIGSGAVGGSKVLSEQTFEVAPTEKGGKNTTWGDQIELLSWEKVEGQRGFYVNKMFDHGDDSTHICCAAGAAAAAQELTGLVDAAVVDSMVALCMSTTFTF